MLTPLEAGDGKTGIGDLKIANFTLQKWLG